MNDFTVHIEKQLSRLGRDIQEFVEKIVPVQDMKSDFSPQCDIVEADREFRILLDLPGMEKKEIQLNLKEDVLWISGERQISFGEGEKLKRKERKSGSFSRSFVLPEHAAASEASASFQNGVLTVTVPKRENEAEGQSIPIT